MSPLKLTCVSYSQFIIFFFIIIFFSSMYPKPSGSIFFFFMNLRVLTSRSTSWSYYYCNLLSRKTYKWKFFRNRAFLTYKVPHFGLNIMKSLHNLMLFGLFGYSFLIIVLLTAPSDSDKLSTLMSLRLGRCFEFDKNSTLESLWLAAFGNSSQSILSSSSPW